MGMFSYMCKISGEQIRSDLDEYDKHKNVIRLYYLKNGKIIEEMHGLYNGYGAVETEDQTFHCIYDENGNPNFLGDGAVIEDGRYISGEILEGIYLDMPNDMYHSLDALNSSKLKCLSKSGRHYYRQVHDELAKSVSTQLKKTFDRGTLAHAMILEPEIVHKEFARDVDKDELLERGELLISQDDLKSYCKEHKLKVSGNKKELSARILEHDSTVRIYDVIETQHRLANINKHMIDAKTWDAAERMYRSHKEHYYSNIAIQDGFPELTVIARCPNTGMLCRVRFDYISRLSFATDVKTAASADPLKVKYQMRDLRYDLQQAYYTYVASLAGINLTGFMFSYIETDHADICQPYELDELTIVRATNDMHTLMAQLKQAEELGDYQGYASKDTVITLSLV